MIIVLAQLGDPGTTTLVNEVKGIDILIAGDGFRSIHNRKIGETIVTSLVNKGRAVGELVLQWDAAQKRIDSYEYNTYSLHEDVRDDPEMVEAINEYDDYVNEQLRIRKIEKNLKVTPSRQETLKMSPEEFLKQYKNTVEVPKK